MPSRLKDHLNSHYFEAANQMTSKKARRRIVAYVESYDDIYFWRTVLSRFETDKMYFEVMLPSHQKLERGKKSVLMNFIERGEKGNGGEDVLGPDMIACVDADYDYLLQGATSQSRKVVGNPYVFHTYAYAIENLQCYAPSLHDVCVAVTLNDHRIFDFIDYMTQYSEAIFPLFVWSVWAYRSGHYNEFSLTDRRFSKITKFMADILYDENFGGKYGNCHVAVGASYADTFSGPQDKLDKKLKEKLGFNDSSLHWDLINTEDKTVTATLKDGSKKKIYEKGQFKY